MKKITILIIIISLLILFVNQLNAKKSDKQHYAFSGMSKKQAIEVQKAAAEHFNLPLNMKITLDDKTIIDTAADKVKKTIKDVGGRFQGTAIDSVTKELETIEDEVEPGSQLREQQKQQWLQRYRRR